MDPKTELYMNMSPYNYAANTPINSIDPDGEIVLFINGMHLGFEGGDKSYWRWEEKYTQYKSYSFMGYQLWSGMQKKSREVGFDKSFMNHFNDRNAEYYDGANGGLWGFPDNLNPSDRFFKGYSTEFL